MKKFLIFLGCTIGVAAITVAVLTLSGISIFGFNFGNSSDNTPHEHSFGEWAVVEEATCTENGTRERACACGEKETEAIEAAGHSFVTYISDENATCTEDGTKTAKCERCNETDTVTDAETKLGHSYTSVVTDPTCTTNGITTHTCSVCGDVYTDNEIVASGHVAGESKVVTEPTCTTGGYTTYTCEVCGESYQDDEIDPVHIYTKWTITESGDTTDTYMKSCDCGHNTEIMSNVPKASEGLAMTPDNEENPTCYTVTGRGTYTGADIVIPATYNGLPVVAIGDQAFMWDDTISSITIIGGVKTIGTGAFVYAGCCTKIIISDSVTSIGEMAFLALGVNLTMTYGTPLNVYYMGTTEQWAELEKSISSHNDEITNADVICDYVFSE